MSRAVERSVSYLSESGIHKVNMRDGLRSIKLRTRPGVLSGLRHFAFLIFAFSLAAHAAKIYPSEGSASAAFLKIGVGARAVGMGEAYTAVSDDPYAMYWNPAGLALLKDRNLAFTHNDYFAGFTQEYAAYTAPAPHIGLLPSGSVKNGVVGASFNYFYYGSDLERRSGDFESGNNLSPAEGKFGAHDMAVSLGYGASLSSVLRAGAAINFIQQSIDTRSAASAALDLGALYDFDFQGRAFTAGLAVQNIGPGIKFIDRRYPLPLTASAGLSTRLNNKSLLLSFDVSKPIDNYPSFALGLEQKIAGRLFLRAGYRLREYGNESGGLSGFALGLGFISGPFSFDYAMSPFGDLGNTQRFSATLRFSGPGTKAAKAADKTIALSSATELELRVTQKPLAITRGGITSLVRVEVIAPGIAAATPPAAQGTPQPLSAPVPVLSSSPVAGPSVTEIPSAPIVDQSSVPAAAQLSSTVAVQAAPGAGSSSTQVQPVSVVPSENILEGVSLRALSFVSLARGEGQVSVTITEGALPKAALEKFPAASGPLTAWQLSSSPYGLKGDIRLEFDAGKTPGAGGLVLYYLAGRVWKTAEVITGDCGEKMCRYLVSVPYSQYYAVVMK